MTCTFSFLLFTFAFCENDIAIVVNGDNIYRDDYDYATARYEESYKKYFGDNIDDSVRGKIKKESIDDLINKQLYLQEAKRRGITAKAFAQEEEIEELVVSDPKASQEGQAARDRAEEIILGYKMRELIPPKVIASIKEDISVDDKEVVDEYLKRADKMRVKYIKIDPVALANKMAVSEDEIKAYYKNNSDKFSVPAVKKYAVLRFGLNDYPGKTGISGQALKEYYKAHMDDFWNEGLARVKYVVFRTKDYLNQVYDLGVNPRRYYEKNLDKFIEPAEAKVRFISIKKPCDRKKLQSLRGELKNGEDLGYIKEGTLKEPFNTVVFGLASGEVSDIIETDNSYCVFYVQEKKEERTASFDEVRGRIEEQLLNEAARPLALSDAKRFKIEARKIGFEKAATQKGLTTFETGYFKSSDRIPTIGRNLLFTSTALDLGAGEISNEIDYDDGYAVIKVVDVKTRRRLTFPEVSEKIRKKLSNEDSMAAAESAAKNALGLLSEGVPLNGLKSRMTVHISTLETSSTLETESDVGVVTNKIDGCYVTVLATEEPSYVPPLNDIFDKVAVAMALDNADRLASEEANELLLSGAVTGETASETATFSKDDYVIGTEYMRPFIEQCFTLKRGETAVVNSSGKYYVVHVIERGIHLADYQDESPVIKSQVLKEKRADYAKEWLKKEREKAQIQINI